MPTVAQKCGNLTNMVVCYDKYKFNTWCNYFDTICNGTISRNISTIHLPVDSECTILIVYRPTPVVHYTTTTPRPISKFETRLFMASIHGIDDLLLLSSRTNATIDEQKKIFSTQDHSKKYYVRSQKCWAHSLDLTAISPWNSQGHTRKAGVLITPRHALWARHYSMKVNTTIRFVDGDNNVVDRKIVKTRAVPNEGHSSLHGYDIVVGELDQDVPSEISFVKVLPRNITTIRTSGFRIPAFDTDFEEKALVADLSYERGNMVGLATPSHQSIRYPYFETKIVGDSGNPVFLVIDGEIVLLFVFTYGGSGSGTSITYHYNNINQILQNWGSNYRLTEVDLSKYLESGNEIPNIIG
ncbi:hypothetical protein ACF0H5_015077 [Mactra antiquata]